MDITPYVDHLRRDLLAAAEAGGDEVRTTAERLAYALESATRLALMEAISQAAAEITTQLEAGSVDVRLTGRDLDFVIEVPPPAPQAPAPPTLSDAPNPEESEEGLARVTLRIPESLKAKAEDKAAAASQSLNTWLVALVRQATNEHAINIDIDLSSIPFLGDQPGRGRGQARKMTGWI